MFTEHLRQGGHCGGSHYLLESHSTAISRAPVLGLALGLMLRKGRSFTCQGQPLIAQGGLPRLKGFGCELPKVTERVAEPGLLPPVPVLICDTVVPSRSLGSVLG